MTAVDREGLKAWYREALRRRVEELDGLRGDLALGTAAARTSARGVGHALRGSGGTFGFPEVTDAGKLLEDAPDQHLVRRVEGTAALLRRIAWHDDPGEARAYGWIPMLALEDAAPDPARLPFTAETLEAAWAECAGAAGVSEEELAQRLGERFGLPPSETLEPDRAALRLVPEALIREYGVLPLTEDGEHILVASSDPTDLAAERALLRMTGREIVFVVAPPTRLREAIERVIEETGDPAGSSASRRAERDAAQPRSPATVLVVDDDPSARLFARAVLERKHFLVKEAPGGAEALAALQEERGIGLAVVDLQMPGMSGQELLRSIRASDDVADLPVVVLTGSEDPELEAQLIDDGADDYIRKPVDPRLFVSRISATLRRAGR